MKYLWEGTNQIEKRNNMPKIQEKETKVLTHPLEVKLDKIFHRYGKSKSTPKEKEPVDLTTQLVGMRKLAKRIENTYLETLEHVHSSANVLPAPDIPEVFCITNFSRQNREKAHCYIGRKGPFGNPFVIGTHGDRQETIDKYEKYITQRITTDPAYREYFVKALAGKHLVCHCKPLACHGDVILRLLSAINCNALPLTPHRIVEENT